MKNRKDRKNKIPKASPPIKGFRIPNQPDRTLKENINADDLQPIVSFYHYDSSSECVSHWTASETKQLFDQLKMFSSMTWRDVLKSGGKRDKSGIAYTSINTAGIKRAWPTNLSPDANITEIRICQTKRAFGIRKESTFYLVWLDRKHAVCK